MFQVVSIFIPFLYFWSSVRPIIGDILIFYYSCTEPGLSDLLLYNLSANQAIILKNADYKLNFLDFLSFYRILICNQMLTHNKAEYQGIINYE